MIKACIIATLLAAESLSDPSDSVEPIDTESTPGAEDMSLPVVCKPWRPVYTPVGRVFPGPDGPTLRAGTFYEDWIPNDHSFVKAADGQWHLFGITGPDSPIIHEAEWQAFHVSGSLDHLPWTEHDLVLTPSDRPGDDPNLWAPFVIEREGVYHLFFGPDRMGHAISNDLFTWTPQKPVFVQDGMTRDPWITQIDGLYHMVYVAGSDVWLRTSADLVNWSEPGQKIFAMRRPGNPESPMLIEYGNHFYLFYTIHDGTNTNYDNRTFVFVSDTPHDFMDAEEITWFEAHAPEIFRDGDSWYISSVEWPSRGVSIARLIWEER